MKTDCCPHENCANSHGFAMRCSFVIGFIRCIAFSNPVTEFLLDKTPAIPHLSFLLVRLLGALRFLIVCSPWYHTKLQISPSSDTSHVCRSDCKHRTERRYFCGRCKFYVKFNCPRSASSEFHKWLENAARNSIADYLADVSRGYQALRSLVRFRRQIFRRVGFRMYVSKMNKVYQLAYGSISLAVVSRGAGEPSRMQTLTHKVRHL